MGGLGSPVRLTPKSFLLSGTKQKARWKKGRLNSSIILGQTGVKARILHCTNLLIHLFGAIARSNSHDRCIQWSQWVFLHDSSPPAKLSSVSSPSLTQPLTACSRIQSYTSNIFCLIFLCFKWTVRSPGFPFSVNYEHIHLQRKLNELILQSVLRKSDQHGLRNQGPWVTEE